MDTFRTPEEPEEVLDVPTLSCIPNISEESLRLIKGISAFSPLMEAYRSLRVNLKFVTTEQPVRSLLVTSAVPGEGKSTTVANLAMAHAMTKKCVLIVDADLRRPTQHQIFRTNSIPGLTDLLNGETTLDAVIRPTSVSNVSYIPAGNPPPNPTELLETKEMAQTLAELEERYDLVLFDSPPTLAVADAAVLAAQVSGTLLVIGFDETKVTNVRATMKVLSRARATVLGTVLNRMSGPASGYYYGKYYVPSVPNGVETTAEAPPTAEESRPRIRRPRRA
jgi:capsular exopolysaccharide synthesis family protein